MVDTGDYAGEESANERPVDPQQAVARAALEEYFDQNPERVFFSRQIEVIREGTHFHWITNRVLRQMVADGALLGEKREIAEGNSINLIWHTGYRFYRRAASRVIKLVEEYADPNIGAALGLHGEMLVLEAFARNRFLLT